jgi:high-affinity nickel-transport protein
MTLTESAPELRPAPIRQRLSPGIIAFIVLLHVLGWGSLLLLVIPQALEIGADSAGTPIFFGLGIGLTAYALGLRHAFDADHIAAIDNTTRRLLANNRPASSVGFWFSLGHSTIVVLLCVLLAFGVRAVGSQLSDEGSPLHEWTGVIGPTVSSVFLIMIGLLNLWAVVSLVRVLRVIRRRGADAEADRALIESHLDKRGFLARVVSKLNGRIRSPWQMYPVGLLFGLGFDTATEIGLLVLAGTASAFALPWYAILTLPVLFAAGMSMLDTTQGVLMRRAYSWAGVSSVRSINYNLIVTSFSVAIALTIGVIQLSAVLDDELSLGGAVAWLASLDLDSLGFVLTGVVLAAWAVFAIVQAASRGRRAKAG